MEKVNNKKLIAKGTYNIVHDNKHYSFKGGNSYEIDEKTAEMFVKSNYCSYAEEVKDGKNKGNKASDNIK